MSFPGLISHKITVKFTTFTMTGSCEPMWNKQLNFGHFIFKAMSPQDFQQPGYINTMRRLGFNTMKTAFS